MNAEGILYLRLKDASVQKKLAKIMAQSDQPMREVVEQALIFAFSRAGFKVPMRAPAYLQAAATRAKRRRAKAKKLAG